MGHEYIINVGDNLLNTCDLQYATNNISIWPKKNIDIINRMNMRNRKEKKINDWQNSKRMDKAKEKEKINDAVAKNLFIFKFGFFEKLN